MPACDAWCAVVTRAPLTPITPLPTMRRLNPMSYGSEERPRLIKCVVWDLDNTLWAGTAVEGEADTLPPADPRILDIINTLEKRGIASSVASRNDPSLLQQINGHPDLSGLFVAPQVSWGPKS